LVEQITLGTIKNEPDRLFEVAKLRLMLELPNVIQFAYFGRRFDFHSAEAHIEYMNLFKAHKLIDEPDLSAETIAEGTTAYLNGPDGERIVSVLAESESLRSPNELHASSPLAARLLGRRAGEQVVIKQTALEEQIVVIREVISNYVWAYRESWHNFTTWFPDNPAIEMGGNDEASRQRLARHMQDQTETFAALVAAYEQRKISLPLFAEHASIRPADAWRRLWSTPDVAMRVSTVGASCTLNDKDAVILELTALLTLAFLDVLEPLRQRFRVVVAQLTLDELSEEILQIGIQELSAIALANAVGDAAKSTDLNEAQKRQESFLNLRSFVELRTERLVSTSLLSTPTDTIVGSERILGRSGLHSILIAKDHHLPVIIDDGGVREIAIRQEKVAAASSLDVLNELRRCDLLSENALADATKKLRMARYDLLSG
jgi:hypothetical protein